MRPPEGNTSDASESGQRINETSEDSGAGPSIPAPSGGGGKRGSGTGELRSASYGTTGNPTSLSRFRTAVVNCWRKWLSRRNPASVRRRGRSSAGWRSGTRCRRWLSPARSINAQMPDPRNRML
jgi:hypothetical protein